MLKLIKSNLKILAPIILFLSFLLPFANTIPYMDGNIDFVQVLDFYSGGLSQYFLNWNTVHPPLKLILISPLFNLFGPSPIIYNSLGIFFGVLGIISLFLLTKKISNKRSAITASLFISIYPLFISNSLFVMRDLMLTALILTSIYFYADKKYLAYSLFASLAILTKETALLLPVIVIFTELLYLLMEKTKFDKKFIIRTFSIFIPIFTYYLWKTLLSWNGKNSWSEWIFTSNENKSASFTIINNLLTFDFLNPFAQAHLKQLLFLNFNWVYISLIIFLILFFIFTRKINFSIKFQNSKPITVIIIFVISYILCVLTLQTYTIPRYALPITPFIFLCLAVLIEKLNNSFQKKIINTLVICIIFISLFFSIDPLASAIWGKTNILGHEIYALNEHMAGNDGITYNLEYLLIAKERSDLIKNSLHPKGIRSDSCRWIFPDPNNEIKTFNILKLNFNNISCNNY